MTVFCPKCHQEVCKVIKADGQTKIVQGGKTLITTTGAKMEGLSVTCPAGHSVLVDKHLGGNND
ncbi:hypothetical protein ES703_115703 [subsurface metagenome]